MHAKVYLHRMAEGTGRRPRVVKLLSHFLKVQGEKGAGEGGGDELCVPPISFQKMLRVRQSFFMTMVSAVGL